jgi:mRNA interferase MazF
MNSYPQRGDIYWVNLDPTVGAEINKRRPCLIVSNDVGNEVSLRVIVAPITSSVKQVYPFEVEIELNGRQGKALLDQVRSLDKQRLAKKMAFLSPDVMGAVDKALKVALALK